MDIDDLAPYSSHESLSKPASLEELLEFQDWRFVKEAYELLLAREPEKEGYRFYVSRIRSGVSKIQILKEIGTSPEAASRGGSITGLRKALILASMGSLPVIGSIFRRLFSLEGNSTQEVRLRVLEQRDSVLSDMLQAIVSRQNAVDTKLSQVPQLIGDLSRQLTSLSERIASLKELTASDTQNVAQSVEALRQRQSMFAQSTEDLGHRLVAFAQSIEDLRQRQTTFAQFVEDLEQRLLAFAQSVEDLGKRQSTVETNQLPTLFQTLSDLNQRQLASDNDRDNLMISVPVALRRLARDIAEGEKKMMSLEALLESRYEKTR